ncbi:DUF3159 domain-containing protein [Mycolicibacterium sp. YH-1]|uniref:DUF3159 domain-containing protein n=1 Tax=Mycolicibacterium sp. YH-1 TaxID=2908837 RepID=UPI00352DC206
MTSPDNGAADETASDGQDRPESKLNAQAILEQMGGISGLIYSSLPVVVFVPVSSFAGLMPAIYAALGVATLILVWRLIRRDSLQPAVSGFFAVGVSALIAYIVGESKGFFLLGIWSSLIYAGVFALSVLIRRPIVGYVWGWANGRDRGWRDVRRAVRAFDLATLTWVLVFGARFVVQNHLYDENQTGLLGVARIAMGWPLTAVAALVTYLAIRAAQRAVHADEDEKARAVEGGASTQTSETSNASGPTPTD